MPFTGIVEEMGVVESMEKVDNLTMWDGSVREGYLLTVKPQRAGTCLKAKASAAGLASEGAEAEADPSRFVKLLLEEQDCYEGCSIAVNGVCLTVRSFDPEEAESFTFGIAPETLKRTNLGKLSKGSKVNLERAQQVGGRNSGHYVQGHVDQVGSVLSKTMEEDMLVVRISVPRDLMRFVVEKGYIAIDGTSLTVVQVDPAACWFSVMLIAHTQQAIILPTVPIGGQVNLEVDVMAKYLHNSSLAAGMRDLENRVRALELVLLATGAAFVAAMLGKYLT